MQQRGARIATTMCAVALEFVSAERVEALPVRGGELQVRRSDAAQDCPDEPALLELLAAIEESAPAAGGSAIDVEVELDRDSAGYVARIRASGAKTGERELRDSGATCAPLAYATSVALAILFDSSPELSQLRFASTSPPAAAPDLDPRVARPAPEQTTVRPSPRPPWPTTSLAVQLGLGTGMIGYAMTGQISGSLRLRANRRWEVGAGALWLPGRELPHGSGVASVSIIAGRADVTVTVAEARSRRLGVSIGGCVGTIRGSGLGYDHDYASSALWLAPALGAVGSWRLASGGALSLSSTLLVPHRRQTFRVARVPGVAFESAPAAAFLELGAELPLL